MRKVAVAIFDALEQIPAALGGARRVMNIFKDSKTLQSHSDTLYKSVLAAMRHMLEYLRRKSVRKIFKVILKQQRFEDDLMVKINNIIKSRDAFNHEAEVCHRKVVQQLSEASAKNADEAQEIYLLLSRSTEEQQRSQRFVAPSVQDIQPNDVTEITRMLLPCEEILNMLRSNLAAVDYAYSFRTCPLEIVNPFRSRFDDQL